LLSVASWLPATVAATSGRMAKKPIWRMNDAKNGPLR
jgi:hypothetical protein